MKATISDIRITASQEEGFAFYAADVTVAGLLYAATGALGRHEAGAFGHRNGRPYLTVRARLSRAGSPRQWLGFDAPEQLAIREALLEPLGIISECSCGAVFTAAAWQQLELVGDVDGVLEQRNCPCGSTCSAELVLALIA